jgi:sodium/bile acid cotransporter 7
MATVKEASSFASDVTFSKPIQLQLSNLGKQTPSISFSEKSETIRSPIQRPESVQETEESSKLKRFCTSLGSRLKSLLVKYWFLLGLVVVILLAWQFPNVGRKGGYIRAEWSIKWGKIESTLHHYRFYNNSFGLGAVIVIFLISGLSLRTRILAQTILRIRLHLLIQIINLVLIPFFVFGLVLLFFKLHMPVNSLLLIGVVIAQSTPTTVSSNVVMTKNANGNEASGKIILEPLYCLVTHVLFSSHERCIGQYPR